MCTLTYIPIARDHRMITSNRDESRLRKAALAPEIYKVNGKKLLYPKDPVGGGSWIVTSDNGLTACLLNGAYQPHTPKTAYRKSRGLIVVEMFEFEDMFQFSKNIDLTDIEPFTLVMIDKENILELKWTGSRKNLRFYNPSLPLLWASEQLYSHSTILKRKKGFKNLLEKGILSKKDIILFHEIARYDDKENEMKLERENLVATISITSLEIYGNSLEMYYKDLLMNKETSVKLNVY
jgi:hypothetical protein